MAFTYFAQEINVIPNEIPRDALGMTRVERIRYADCLVKQARFLADGRYGDLRFSELSTEAYYGWLMTAVDHYRAAGLGLLAERIDAVIQKDPEVAWVAFDAMDAGET